MSFKLCYQHFSHSYYPLNLSLENSKLTKNAILEMFFISIYFTKKFILQNGHFNLIEHECAMCALEQ